MVTTDKEILERIHSLQIPRLDGCYDWGGLDTGGKRKYALIYIKGQAILVARFLVSVKFNIDINSRFDTMHSCDYPPCTNDAHLSYGTRSDNINDSVRKGRWTQHGSNHLKTACIRGHKFVKGN